MHGIEGFIYGVKDIKRTNKYIILFIPYSHKQNHHIVTYQLLECVIVMVIPRQEAWTRSG